jgi:hypothetical protein
MGIKGKKVKEFSSKSSDIEVSKGVGHERDEIKERPGNSGPQTPQDSPGREPEAF